MKFIDTAAILMMSLFLLTGCKSAESFSEPSAEVIAPSETAISAETTVCETTLRTTAAETTTATTTVLVHTAPPEDAVLPADCTVEVYASLTLRELLQDCDVELLNGDVPVATEETGVFDISVEYLLEGEQYAHPLAYTVVDTTAPLLLNAGWNVCVKQGETFDLNDHVGYADQYDRRPVLTYTGMVDTSVCGIYPITATVRDASGNATVWDLEIEVAEQLPQWESSASSLPFATFQEQYAAEHVSFGIDVSKWQGEIDFEAVKDAGCSFVIMRMGYYFEEAVMDEYYLRNMEKAKAAGLDVGVYLYTTANTEEEVRENVRWITQQLQGQTLDFPVVFDWESFSGFQQYGMNIHDLNKLFDLFSEELEQQGYSAMLYGSKNVMETFWYEHSDAPVWLAHYTDQTDYQGDYVMWQMSCTGRIPGISGDVDLNILYTDRAKAFW